MTASYLAQESMETIKNIRDNNLALGNNWLIIPPGPGFLSSCLASKPCDASAIDSLSYNGSPTILTGASTEYPLKLNALIFYSHAAGTATPFARHFYLTKISPDEYVVTVSVDWTEGSLPYNVTVNSEVINNIR
jgi:hypothetical protein